ncbi:hypothetical protein AAFC00_000388 [Neodothiora populina]|uniref:WW domain-containing protein n=1 Tax=Neodothiora populina TaxID=2781224 RepID=A0ABR3PCW9_9PEZI
MDEAPERKKLRPSGPALPPAWTEHTAPTGHKYYYNTQTKQSTYTRPVAATPPRQPQPALYPPLQAYNAPAQDYAALAQSYQTAYNPYPQTQYPAVAPYQQAHFQVQPEYNRKPQQRRPPPEDRPKRKALIPSCEPWVLVYTKLGRRFVHNTSTGESFWKFPPDVMSAVIEYDKLRLEKKLGDKPRDEGTGANNVPVGRNNRRRRSESLQREDEAALAALAAEDDAEDGNGEGKVVPITNSKTPGPQASGQNGKEDGDSSSEYEEVEVTDDEDEEEKEKENEHENNDPDPDAPVEFGEDDIAYQLAQMGADYGLDPGEYDDGNEEDLEPGAEGLALSDEDSAALFKDLLNDHQLSPFTPWDNLLSNDDIVSDWRYTALPTTRARHEVWDEWSRDRIAAIRAARSEVSQKQDPRIPYLTFLSENCRTPKLYWPEFKRKFKKESIMRQDSTAPRFGDKEREKLYRNHVARLKLPERQLKSDLAALLKSLPLTALNRDTVYPAMSESEIVNDLQTDLRFISLPPSTRDPLIKAHVSTLAPAPLGSLSEEDAAAVAERQK